MKTPSHRRAQSPLRHAQTRHMGPGDDKPQPETPKTKAGRIEAIKAAIGNAPAGRPPVDKC